MPGENFVRGGVGHFLTNGRFPVNMLQEMSVLDPEPRPHGVVAYGDNPLMFTGKLLIALAVEASIGSIVASSLVDASVNSIASLFPFAGAFSGYTLRRDPVSSPTWSDQRNVQNSPSSPLRALYCTNFLLDDAFQYQLLAPTHDWRRSRRIDQNEFHRLSPDERTAWQQRHKEEDMDRFRDSEPSSDEMTGLITGLYCVWALESGARAAAAKNILHNLGEYLAEHSYFLVRPNGGFSSRGPAAGSVAGEFASQRVFARVLGDPHASRHSVQTVLAMAGLWPSVEKAWNTNILLGLTVLPLVTVAVNVLLPPLPTGDPATDLLNFLTTNAVNPENVGGANALYENQLIFDCATRIANDNNSVDEEYPMEIVLATLLSGLSPQTRLELFMTRWGAIATQGWAIGFMPYLGLTAVDDTDDTVARAYLAMYEARTTRGLPWDTWHGGGRAFATAVALLLTAQQTPTATGVGVLERRLVAELTELEQYFNGLTGSPLPTVSLPQGILAEDADPALDYLVPLALAWLHRIRQGHRNVKVIDPDFPSIPASAELDVAKYQTVPKPPNPTPVPPAKLPQPVTQTVTVTVGPRDGLLHTGVLVRPLDEIEITATGEIVSGEVLSEPSGPDGWSDIADSVSYSMYGADAHKYALIGRLGQFGSPFPVGSHFGPRRLIYEFPQSLDLLVNTWNIGQGSGQFTVTIRQSTSFPPGGAVPHNPTQADRLRPGEGLAPGQQIHSPNGFTFTLQADGTIVTRGQRGTELWSSAVTTQRNVYDVIMQADGNLIVYDFSGPLWASGTSEAGSYLLMQDDGNAVIYSPNNGALWATGNVVPPQPPTPTATNGLQSGEGLIMGQALSSMNGKFTFELQPDGNLVLYQLPRIPLWATGTNGHPDLLSLIMQQDGNLVLYDIRGTVLFTSGTNRNPGSTATMQNDGNFAINSPTHTALWTTGTTRAFVPSVTTLPVSTGFASLRAAGLVPNVIETRVGGERPTIVLQDPPGDTPVKPGSTVSLTIEKPRVGPQP